MTSVVVIILFYIYGNAGLKEFTDHGFNEGVLPP
jgi:hypothetical protein